MVKGSNGFPIHPWEQKLHLSQWQKSYWTLNSVSIEQSSSSVWWGARLSFGDNTFFAAPWSWCWS